MIRFLLLALALPSVTAAQVETILLPDNVAPRQNFGSGVAIASDLAVVGASGFDGPSSTGAVYVYRLVGGSWIQEARLTASDARPRAQFGAAVAADGDLILVGAPRDSTAYLWGGSAYVFRRTASGWHEEAKLVASDIGKRDSFGEAVALAGNLAVIGSSGASGPTAGGVYVFRRDDATGAWTEEAKLHAPWHPYGEFGLSVDVDSGPAGSFIIGVQGRKLDGAAAYVFAQADDPFGSNGGWVLEADLTAMIPSSFGGYGAAVSAEGAQALALAHGFSPGSSSSSSVYAFHREEGPTGGTWVLEAGFRPSQHEGGFGSEIALEGGVAIINGMTYPGADWAFVYRREVGDGDITWEERARLRASDGGDEDYFGWSVAINGGVGLVGAPRASPGGLLYAGAAYAYDLAAVLGEETPPAQGGSFELRVVPNPTQGSITCTLQIPAPAALRLDVFDVLGRKVAEHDLGTLPPGTHSAVMDLAGLGTGTYILRLAGDAGFSPPVRLGVLGR